MISLAKGSVKAKKKAHPNQQTVKPHHPLRSNKRGGQP